MANQQLGFGFGRGRHVITPLCIPHVDDQTPVSSEATARAWLKAHRRARDHDTQDLQRENTSLKLQMAKAGLRPRLR